MFSRLRTDRIECRSGGEHSVTTPRLRVIVARYGAYLAALALSRDPEAQHWLGYDPQVVRSEARTLPVDPVLLTRDGARLIGIDRRSGRIAVSMDLFRAADGCFETGGVVDPTFRGQGMGREALQAVCRMAHQHFGIATLRAGCEVTNLASQRWLSSCGFFRIEGPRYHELPNGRIIESLWWQHVDPAAAIRCRRLNAPRPWPHAGSCRRRAV